MLACYVQISYLHIMQEFAPQNVKRHLYFILTSRSDWKPQNATVTYVNINDIIRINDISFSHIHMITYIVR